METDIRIALLQVRFDGLLTYVMARTEQILEKVRKDSSPPPKRMKTETDLESNLKELETVIDQFKNEIEILQGDLKIKDQRIVELTQQNTRDFEKEKKKTSACTCLRELCNISLEHLTSHQTDNPKIAKVNRVSLDACINRLTDIYENKRANNELLQETAEKEDANNIQKQTTEKEDKPEEILLNRCQAKTEEGEDSLRKCKEVSNLIAQINKYEEDIKMKNASKINELWHDYISKLDQEYSSRWKKLNEEISGKVSISTNKKVRDRYKSFQEKKVSKTEEIEEIQRYFNLLPPKELKNKFEQSFAEVIRDIQEILDGYNLIMFDFPAAETRLKLAYEELTLLMAQESSILSRLDALPEAKCFRAKNPSSVL